MCGIIGYIGMRQAAPILMEGLATLEYRGYDSAGISVIGPNGESQVAKASGKLSILASLVGSESPKGTTGIGHTRWATHGSPTDINAHPHSDCSTQITVVHNGIVENYLELKKQLIDEGHVFSSQTDAECIPHLIESYLQKQNTLEYAVKQTAARLDGANAVVVVSSLEPDKILAFRLGNAGGLVVGYGEDEMLLASDLPAILPHTRRVAYLSDGEVVTLTCDGPNYSLIDNSPLEKTPTVAPFDTVSASKGEYKHYMLKEIYEQPEAVINTLRGRLSFEPAMVRLDEYPFSEEETQQFERVVLLGMGTSLHAAMVGRTWFESLTGIPTEVDNSSEFRYRDPILNNHTLVISISQSGETADTLAAMEEAKRKCSKQLTLVNYEGTQTSRIADGSILIRAGLEIGVAASKTFVCSLTSLYLLAVHMGSLRRIISTDQLASISSELASLPNQLGALLGKETQYEYLAQKFAKHSDFLYLGRGLSYPLAMEGALKLKEISYIHAEGYPAGEMKHGPISLIDENMPVVALIPRNELYEKMLSNVNEVKSRGGIVIAVASEGDEPSQADHIITIPKTTPALCPIVMAVPLQLLAYHIAVRRGCDVDQPRNLAKSVTVE